MNTQEGQSSGVQELIDRLREDGVEKGQKAADSLIDAARQKAAQILDEARKEADGILDHARAEAEVVKSAGQEALRLAARDAVLCLKEAVGKDFESKVRHLVSHTLGDREFLKKLILRVASRAIPEETEGPINVLLPGNVVTIEQLQATPEELTEGTLSHFVLGLTGDILREGLSFDVAGDDAPGVRLRLVQDDLEIELTDETITALLMRHLVPRFRAILERED